MMGRRVGRPSLVDNIVPEYEGDRLHQMMLAYDCFYWIDKMKINLGGAFKPFKIAGHEYQLEILQSNAKREVTMKGAQVGITESYILKTLHGMIFGKYPQGVLYLFPTRDDVVDFSKGRFAPLIDSNPVIGEYVKDTDSANIKKINSAMLYLRGARATKSIDDKKSSSQLKSIPVDCVRFDERDEMDNDMVDLALERISHSEVQEETYLGTPTVPDFGVDKLYKNSDQRIWEIKCGKCGKYTCLELTFPECLHEQSDGSVIRLCQHCKDREIYPKDGQWVAQYPDKAKGEMGLVGRWISQLNSVYVNPGKILTLFNDPPNGNIAEVYNSKLGMAYVSTENKLSKNDVYQRCSNDIMANQHDGPCCMGVDVGKMLHVVIACKTGSKSLKVVKVARLSTFSDVHDLAKRFNVKCGVVDYKPEIKKARDFQTTEPYSVFLCNYQENRRGAVSWDEKERMVLVNRTETCDNTHDLVMDMGRLELPRRCPEIDEFVTEMCNIAKKAVMDEDTKSIEYKYIVLGADHHRHALNYCWLASKRIGSVNESGIISSWFNRRRNRNWKTS